MIVSARLGRSYRKFSERAVSMNLKGKALAASAPRRRRARPRLEVIDRIDPLPVASSIDPPTTPASAASLPIVLAQVFRRIAEPAFEIGRHRKARRFGDRPRVCQILFAADRTMPSGLPMVKADAGAGRRYRLEAQMLQEPGASRIPGIGYDEGAGLLMQSFERRALFLCAIMASSQNSGSCSPGCGGRLKARSTAAGASRLMPSLCAGHFEAPPDRPGIGPGAGHAAAESRVILLALRGSGGSATSPARPGRASRRISHSLEDILHFERQAQQHIAGLAGAGSIGRLQDRSRSRCH